MTDPDVQITPQDPVPEIADQNIIGKLQAREPAFYVGEKPWDLTEAERHLIETMRMLKDQDDTFRFLPQVVADRLRQALQKGRVLNGSASGLMDQMFYAGDESAYHITARNYIRLQQPVDTHHKAIPDDILQDRLVDGANYTDFWMCCRLERKENGHGTL